MEEIEGILQEYVATANNPDYNSDWDIINSKFPELSSYDPELLQEYVATANNPDYNSDWDVINSKFTEFKDTPDVPKGVTAEENGGLVSPSAQEASLSESDKPNNVLDTLEDRGLSLKDRASKNLQKLKEESGIKDYTISDEEITKEALRLKAKDDKDEKYDDWDFWKDTWSKVKANTVRVAENMSAIPSYLNNTMFTLLSSDEELEAVNKLDPKAREAFVNATMFSPTPSVTNLGQIGIEASEELEEYAADIESKITKFDSAMTEDIINGDYKQASLRIASEGIGSLPSIVQTLIPYVGIGSMVAGSAAKKNKELTNEGEDLGLRTSVNAAVNGSAEGLLEIFTKKLGGRLIKSLKGSTSEGVDTIFKGLKEHLVKAPLYEGGSEAATSLIQNLSDMYIQGKDKEFMEVFMEVSDAFLVGYGTGKGLGTSTFVSDTTHKLIDDVNMENIIKSDTNEFGSIKDAFKPDLDNKYHKDRLRLATYYNASNKLSKELKKAVSKGEMTKDEASLYESELAKTISTLKKTQGVVMSEDSRVRAVELVDRKEALKEEIKGMDDALATSKKVEVEKIDQELLTITNQKIDEIKQETTKGEGTDSKQDIAKDNGVKQESEVKGKKVTNKKELTEILGSGTWGMLTGENPNAEQATPEENQKFNEDAQAWLKDKGYEPQPITGKYGSNTENSFIVPNLSGKDAVQFAKDFNQESVATNEGLFYQDGSFHPRVEGDSVGGKYSDNYSTINTPEGDIDFQTNYDFNTKIDGKTESNTKTPQETEAKQEGGKTGTATVVEETSQESSQEDHSIKTVNNAAKDFFMESDKTVATRELKSKVDTLVKRGKLTQAQAKNLIKRATAVDPTNTKQVEKFLKYFEKQAGISEKRDAKAKIKSAKRVVKKRAKQASKRTPANLKDLARDAGNIDERFLNDSDATRYGEILEEISNAFKSSNHKDYKMPKVDKLSKELEALQKKSDEGKEAEFTKKLGGEFEALKTELWKSSEEFSELVSSMADKKATKLKEALSNLAAEVQGKLLKVDTSEMTSKEKKALKTLRDATFGNLTTTQLRDFVKIADNIAINNNFSNSTKLVKAIEADAKTKKIIRDNEASGVNPRAINTSAEAARVFSLKGAGDFVKTFINSMTSLNVMLDWIGGSSKRGAKLYNELGFLDLSNSNVRAITRKQRFSDLYNKQLNKLSKTYKGILEGDQVVRRSVLSTLLQADPNSIESMQFFKDGYIQKSIDSLKSYKVNNQQSKEKVEILESILEELSGVNTKEELIEYLKKNDLGNYKMLKFASDYFLRHTKEFQENSNLSHGETFEARTEEDFYIPLMRSSLVDKSMRGEIEDIRKDFGKTGNMLTFKSGSSVTRKKRAKLQESQTISFDFDTSIMNKYGEQMYDIEASESIINIKSMLSNKALVEHFGLGTIVELQKRALDKIAMDSGSVFQSAQEWEKKLGKVEQTLRKVGSIMALGGIDQFFKQYPAVVVSAGVRLGSDAGLLGKYMFTSKGDIELLKNSSIRLRAESDAGIKRASDDVKYENLSLGDKSKVKLMTKMLVKQGGLTLDKARELSMWSLRVGDVQAAQATFLAYYHSHLRSKGVKDSDIDMRTEHTKLKEGVKHRKEAQAYAQHMVNTTQTSSDLTEGSKFVANPNVLTRFVMGAIMPFSSHSNNAVIRLLKSASNISAGKDVKTNMAEAAASMSEIISFHSIKAFALAPAVAHLGKAIFGGEDDDEELINWAFQTTKAVSSIAGDALPLPDSFEIDLMNYLTYKRTKDQFDEDMSFKAYMKEMKNIQLGKSKSYDPEDAPFLFYRYGDKAGFELLAFDDFGLYDIPVEQAQKVSEAIDLLYDSELTKEGKFGKDVKYELDEEHENFLMVYSLSQLLAMIGTGDATSRRIMEKQYKKILEQSKQ